MIPFLILTVVLIVLLGVLLGIGRRAEIMANWKQYRSQPLMMATAFLYKPADDPRSRFQFADDNFREVLSEQVAAGFKTAFAPMLGVFQLLGQSVDQSVGSMVDIRGVLQTMMESFDQILSIFERRYASTLHRLNMTFQGLQTAMNRVWGVAVNSVWQSIAVVQSIFSTLDLMMKIIIIILAILVGIILFLFLFLWPLVPVILSVIGILATAGMGAAVGGMASTFCFTEDTPVVLQSGRSMPISKLRIGDRLFGDAGTVTATMVFAVDPTTDPGLYDLSGVHVSGSHIVYSSDTDSGRPRPMMVHEHPAARPIRRSDVGALYCLNTTGHRIPVLSSASATIWFADWEELSEQEQLLDWNRYVYETLNPGSAWDPAGAHIDGEAVLHPATMVRMADGGRLEVSNIRPGMIVQDADGTPTRVVGTVAMDPSEVGATAGYISASAWLRTNPRSRWVQPIPNGSAPDDCRRPWRSLATESGSFLLDGGVAVRDFSDVGLSAISKSYKWVLASITPRAEHGELKTGSPK